MPVTYSINVGQITESERKSTINSVLSGLSDNTQKAISPKNSRDAFLSAWSTSAFKQTINSSSIEYIGIDSGNPYGRDIKQKILLGKRAFSGSDIMSFNLLSGDSDILFFNTKQDNDDQSSTKVSILSGTNSYLHEFSPYFRSKTVANEVTFDIINPSPYNGPINIYSSTGRVSINGIVFPTVAETSASASNGRILKYVGVYPNGYLKWDEPNITLSSIGAPGVETNIYGSPSNLNGYSLEFIDDNLVPKKIGGIEPGDSFPIGSFSGQNWPLSEIIRKLLYPYIEPALSISSINVGSGNNLAEIGYTASILTTYKVTRYSYDIQTYSVIDPSNNTVFNGYFTASPGSYSVGTYSNLLYQPTYTGFENVYTLSVEDTIPSLSTTTSSILFVKPVFYSFNMNKVDFSSGLVANQTATIMNNSNKYLLQNFTQSINLNYYGYGYLYFLIPTYGNLLRIKDPNGFILHDSNYPSISSFTHSSVSVLPSSGVSGSINYGSYYVYRTIATCSYTGIGNFEFIF